MARAVDVRFWEKVDVGEDDECWDWMGTASGFGHGQLWVNGRSVGAHRVSYELNVGQIPDGLQVLHKCDNPSCVNPRHLFLGNQRDNVIDAVQKGRWTQAGAGVENMVHGIGEENVLSKVTREQVQRIRKLYSEGMSQQAISELFPISRSAVGQIVRRETWKHI